MRGLRVEHALVHVDVDDVGAAAHLVERHLRARPRSRPPGSARAKRFEPVTLVRSPIIRKLLSGRDRERLEAGEAA